MSDRPRLDFGRRTPLQRLSESVFPLGLLPFKPGVPPPSVAATDDYLKDLKQVLLRVVGSAIYLGDRRLLSTRGVLETLHRKHAEPYILVSYIHDGKIAHIAVPIRAGLAYNGSAKAPLDTDAAVLLCAPLPPGLPEPRPVSLGDSEKLGMGDQVAVIGFPLGTDLFLEYRFGRGLVQPTAYSATIGAVVPALDARQTPLLRLTVPGIGGLAGGAICDPRNGTVVGIVTSPIHSGHLPQPVLYGTPITPLKQFVKSVTFDEKAVG